jgi:hypothetical protein
VPASVVVRQVDYSSEQAWLAFHNFVLSSQFTPHTVAEKLACLEFRDGIEMVLNKLAHTPFKDAMERNCSCEQCKYNHHQNYFQPAWEKVHGNPGR